MSIWQTIILGVIEGLTEFLPVSSTAHLMIFSKLFGLVDSNFLRTFEIAIQLGAIFAVLALYFKKIFSDLSLIKNIVIGFLPTAIIGFVLYGVFKNFLSNIFLSLVMLFLGGVALIIFNKCWKEKDEILDPKKSFLIGVWQSLAMIPGVSRSMVTILGSMILGLSKKAAVEFSFLLALPTMFSATVYDIYKNYSLFSLSEWQSLATGFLVAFLSSIISVKWFLGFVKKKSFSSFGWYRIVFAAVIFLILF